MADAAVRLIAFYLPQHHSILENDQGWGARPLIQRGRWGDGCYLEPDRCWGRAHLHATRDAFQAEDNVEIALSGEAVGASPISRTRS